MDKLNCTCELIQKNNAVAKGNYHAHQKILNCLFLNMNFLQYQIKNIYYHKFLGLNIAIFWKNIIQSSIGLVIPIICGIIISMFITFNNIVVFL